MQPAIRPARCIARRNHPLPQIPAQLHHPPVRRPCLLPRSRTPCKHSHTRRPARVATRIHCISLARHLPGLAYIQVILHSACRYHRRRSPRILPSHRTRRSPRCLLILQLRHRTQPRPVQIRHMIHPAHLTVSYIRQTSPILPAANQHANSVPRGTPQTGVCPRLRLRSRQRVQKIHILQLAHLILHHIKPLQPCRIAVARQPARIQRTAPVHRSQSPQTPLRVGHTSVPRASHPQ